MINRTSIKTLGLLFVLGSAPGVEAQVFKITAGTRAAPFTSDAQYRTFLDSLEDEVNQNLPSVETGQYTKGMANATAMAGTGAGIVYGASYKYGLVGANLSLGADLGEGNSLSSIDAKKVAGFAIQSSAVIGFTPGTVTTGQWGPIDPARLRVYLSFMSLSQSVDGAEASFSTMGLMGQYRLIDEKSLGLNLVKWNGVDVSSGLRYGKMKLNYVQVLDVDFEDTGTGATASVTGPATIGADVSIFTVPVEVSSSVRLLYVLNLFGGIGADFNFGSSKAIANYDSNITISGGSTATGDLDLGTNASPTLANLRMFAGLGMEFAVGTLSAGVGKSVTSGAWMMNAGLNFFY
jgi:hypothetical protein